MEKGKRFDEEDDGGDDDDGPSSCDPYPRGNLPTAPPINSVATATAGLRDDVECI